MPTEGGEARAVSGSGPRDRPIGWSADRRSLYVYQRGEVPARIARLELATGRRETWMEWAPADRAGLVSIVVAPMAGDGAYYVYTYVRVLSELYLAEGLR